MDDGDVVDVDDLPMDDRTARGSAILEFLSSLPPEDVVDVLVRCLAAAAVDLGIAESTVDGCLEIAFEAMRAAKRFIEASQRTGRKD